MTYPASVTTVTVTGRWRYADGSAAIPTGYVTFTPNATLQVPADGDTLPARPLRAVLDAQGEISVTLMSTADPDVEPTGWAYLVAEHVGPPRDPYLAQFPAVAPGQTYDLADIAPAVSDPLYAYVLLASVGAVGGPAGPLDGSGLIPAAQIPPSASGVASVNGHTGVVVLAAADVGAQPVDADLTTIAGLTPTTDNVIQSVAGAWASRTPAQLKGTLALSKGDVGLGNVDNTSDANKPVSTAQAAADAAVLAASQPLDSDLTAYAALAAAGFVVRTGSGTVSVRSLVAGSSKVSVANGDGVAGNASIDVVPANFTGIPESGVTGLVADLATLTSGVANSQPLDADLTALAALSATAGMLARTGAGAFAVRTIVAGSTNVVVSQGDGAAGAPSIDLNTLLKAIGALAGNGLIVQTAAGTVANRTLTGSTETGVTNGDGVAGNPTLTVTAVAPTASAPGDTVVNGGVATHRHAREGFAAPSGQNQGTGSSGSSASISHADHAHPYDLWSHLDHIGSGAWNMDPAVLAGQTTSTPVAGTIYVAKLWVPIALAGATTIWMHVITAGSGLTANQCLAGLFDGSKNLLGTSADQSGVWNSGGLKQMTFTSTPVNTTACYVGWFYNGTTAPRFHAGGNGVGAVNFGLSNANSRFATADTGRTTSFPSTLGTLTASSNALWAAVS